MTQDLLNTTNGQGFDIILNDHTNSPHQQASSCVAEGGQYVYLSDRFSMNEMSMDLVDRTVSVSSKESLNQLKSSM